MGARAFTSAIVLAAVATTSPTLAQEWTAYASPEEGFAVEAPGAPQLDHKGFDAKTMTAVRNHTWPKPSGDGAYMVGVMFRNRVAMAQTPPEAAIRDQMAEAKGACQELRDERPLDVAGGLGKEFVVDKCPQGVAFKGRIYVVDERIVAVAAVGPSGVDQAADTQRFLDSVKLTPVIPAEWKSYTIGQDGFSVDLPGTPTIKEGGFHPNTFVSGRVHETSTRSAHYAVTVGIRRRDGMTMVPNEQLLAVLLQQMKGDCEIREQRLSVPGGIGAEFVKDKCPDDNVLKGRFYLVDDRLYQLVAAWPAGMEQTDTNRFFESFGLLMAATPAPTAAAEPPQWKTFASKDDGFSVDFPGAAAPRKVELDPQTMVSNRQFGLDQGHTAWIVTVTQFRPGRKMGDDAWLTGIMGAIKGECALRDDRRTAFPGGLALDFVLDKCPDGTVGRMRLYALGDRLYQAIVAGAPGVESRPETHKFFDSFKLTAPTPAVAAVPQPAAPAAPAPSAGRESVSSLLEGAMKRFPDSPQGADAGGGRDTAKQRQAAAPPPAPAANVNWGALAIDVGDSDPSYGIGGGDSEAKAIDNAMRFCRRAGGKGCKVVVTYNQCAAYAASRRNAASGKGATQKAAEAQALEACNDRCRIVVSDCN